MASAACLPEQTWQPATSWSASINDHASLLADKILRPAAATYHSLTSRMETALTLKPTTAELTPQFSMMIGRLNDILRLPAGWDSYAAKAVNPTALVPALELIFAAMQKNANPRIEAGSDGSVELFWEGPQRVFQVSVHGPSKYEVYFEDSQSGEEFDQIEPVGLSTAKQLLNRFVAPV
jgi:hypothetical protein